MFNLFKKQKTDVNKVEEIFVHSRLNFVHNPKEIEVFKFYLKPIYDQKLSDMKADNVFICNGVVEYVGYTAIYPVFKMPKKMPATRMISIRKIMCIGSVVVNTTTNEIECLSSEFTGMNLEEINSTSLNMIINNDTLTSIMCMHNNGPVKFEIVEGDDIDRETYERSITLNNVIELVLDDYS